MLNNYGLYLHVPFCRKKCAYCNFYSAIFNKDVLSEYVNSLVLKIRSYSLKRLNIDTVYLGGGTPSLLSGADITKIFSAIYNSFSVAENAEITVEANPEDITVEFLSSLKKVGVNRISLGAQTFNTQILKTISRRHTAEDTIKAVKLIREYGFNNLSLDIILGLPLSNNKTLAYDLKTLISLNPEHISAYMLSVEPKTLLYLKKDTLPLKSEDDTANQYLFACDFLKKHGYEHYEISNFAKENFQSRHNNKYWLDKEYMGLGPSAYSFFDGKRFHFESSIKEFNNNAVPVFDENGGDMTEFIMLGLRLKKGISFSDLKEKYSKKPGEKFFKNAEVFIKNGLIEADESRFSLTDKGMLVSNSLITELTKEDNYEDI